jgi:hypothetical protein
VSARKTTCTHAQNRSIQKPKHSSRFVLQHSRGDVPTRPGNRLLSLGLLAEPGGPHRNLIGVSGRGLHTATEDQTLEVIPLSLCGSMCQLPAAMICITVLKICITSLIEVRYNIIDTSVYILFSLSF